MTANGDLAGANALTKNGSVIREPADRPSSFNQRQVAAGPPTRGN
jgi:hypothetical protein